MDPITFSIIRHRLFRVVEEAVITLKHVSRSAITNEGHDLMVSLYQADGSLLMGGVGFLHHLTSAAEACKAVIRRLGGQNRPKHRMTPVAIIGRGRGVRYACAVVAGLRAVARRRW